MDRKGIWTAIGAVASVIAILTFLTGKQSIYEFLEATGTRWQRQPVLVPPINTTPAPARTPRKAVANPSMAVVHTTRGTVTLRLLRDSAPDHVARFVELAESGFYDAVQFRRAVPGVLVEASYRSDNPTTGGYQHPELSDLPFRRGVVGLSTGGTPLREGWQFFIVTGDAPYLNGLYTPVAVVDNGMDVVDAIAELAGTERSPWIMSIDLR